jgi:peptide/nickel transport system substrate-binding protein
MRHRVVLLVLAGLWGACRCQGRSVPDAGPGPSETWLRGELEPERADPRDGGRLVVRSMSEPATLNALEGATSRDTWTLRITRNLVTESLLVIHPTTFALEPQLAASWTDSADHRTSTFVLRDGVTFHDGSPLTSADVVATLTAVMDPARPTGSIRQDFGALGSFKALDARTVEFTWKAPSPFALRQVAKLPILSGRQLSGDWEALAKAPLGTGPFRVGAWVKGESLTLERVRAGAHLDTIVFRFVKDHTVAAGLLEQGAFDLMTAMQPTVWRALEAPTATNAWAWQGYRRLTSVDNSYSYVAWNQARPFFQHVEVRRALAHLYPATLVEQTVDLGLERPTTCPYWKLGPQCDDAVAPLPFSVPAARARLEDAGFVDVDGDGVRERGELRASFSFLVPTTSVRLGKVVPLLEEQARAAGVELRIEKVDVATLNARVNARDFDVVSRVWTESDLESELFGTFHSSARDGGSNFVGYASDEADQLLEAIRLEWDEGRRRELERALHRRLFADQPYLFMTSRSSLDLAKRRVHGLVPSVLWYDLRRVWVED